MKTRAERRWWRWSCFLARLYGAREYSPLYRLTKWAERKERVALHAIHEGKGE
jgi:hypothetical protein